jgi:hypothetical protein
MSTKQRQFQTYIADVFQFLFVENSDCNSDNCIVIYSLKRLFIKQSMSNHITIHRTKLTLSEFV